MLASEDAANYADYADYADYTDYTDYTDYSWGRSATRDAASTAQAFRDMPQKCATLPPLSF